MSGRTGITSTYVSGSVATIRPIYAVYLNFASGVVRTSNAINALTLTDDFGGGVYVGVGQFGTLSNITETSDMAAKTLNLTLSGIPNDYINYAFTDQYRGRDAAVYLLLFNEAYTAYEKTCIFRGRMDTLSVADSDTTSTITISCESRLIEFGRARERRYTDAEQQRLFPGDLGLQYLAASVNKDLYWGSAAPGGSPVAGGGTHTITSGGQGVGNSVYIVQD